MNEGHGIAFENDVERLLNVRYLSDFVARGPKIWFSQKKEEELADAVVVFGKTLFAFQCKSRLPDDPENIHPEKEVGRVEKLTREAVKQLKTIKRALNQEIDLNLVNGKGIRIPEKFSKETPVVGIVLIDIPLEDPLPPEKRLKFYQGADFQHGIPIHLFKREDFWRITEYLDTPKDLFTYLDCRHLLHKRGQLYPATDELDFLMVFKTRYPEVMEHVQNPQTGLMIEKGYAVKFLSTHPDELGNRQNNLHSSYLIDAMIDNHSESIGFNPADEIGENHPDRKKLLQLGRGSVSDHYLVIELLAGFSRIERKNLGDAIIEKRDQALSKNGSAYRMCAPGGDLQSSVLIFFNTGSRQERIDRLYSLTQRACAQKGIEKLLGIGFDPSNQLGVGIDYALVFLNEYSDEDIEALQSPRLFGEMNHARTEEWG